MLRLEDGVSVTAAAIEAIAGWDAAAEPSVEIPFQPARVLMQDFTGVPAVVDLAAMRDAMAEIGGDPEAINPLVDVDLVIDHSVQVDAFGNARAFAVNAEREFERNRERYSFLKWGREAFDNFSVVPPATGICHQVNLEYIAQVVYSRERDGVLQAYPDTLVGTDSHTTMVNGLGVLGWGVGGIEAEAAMLGQPISMLLPQVVGFKLSGELPEGATATDLVLTVTEMLRERGVVSKFVEFFGPGPADAGPRRPGDARQHVAGVRLDLRDLPGRRRDPALPRPHRPPDRDDRAGRRLRPRAGHVRRARRARPGLLRPARARPRRRRAQHRRAQAAAGPGAAGRRQGGLPRGDGGVRPRGRRAARQRHRRGDRRVLPGLRSRRPRTTTTSAASRARRSAAPPRRSPSAAARTRSRSRSRTAPTFELDHGRVVIAAITSCTNTSNPSVMVGAGLLARNAIERGLTRKPWVKTSLAPGSTVVTDYLDKAGLTKYLDELQFNLVGYGCTTCIGNSGPLPAEISAAVEEKDLAVCAVLSGNRNFEGRINQDVKANYLASPPLVVAYALAGRMDLDLTSEPLGEGTDGEPVYLRDIWPDAAEIKELVGRSIASEMFTRNYGEVLRGR